ncbi:hypothetical protein [Patulibacter minatonensis]|uniref:hypothetical protein n=1 Tax=Patulibacter minatonensis TaxID=298163 RepID=UPI0004B04141|nr:hypothetical protein [Patulibacter minatonensis]
MRTARLPRRTATADVATVLAAAGRRDRLTNLTPVLVALTAAAGLLVLALAG